MTATTTTVLSRTADRCGIGAARGASSFWRRRLDRCWCLRFFHRSDLRRACGLSGLGHDPSAVLEAATRSCGIYGVKGCRRGCREEHHYDTEDECPSDCHLSLSENEDPAPVSQKTVTRSGMRCHVGQTKCLLNCLSCIAPKKQTWLSSSVGTSNIFKLISRTPRAEAVSRRRRISCAFAMSASVSPARTDYDRCL